MKPGRRFKRLILVTTEIIQLAFRAKLYTICDKNISTIGADSLVDMTFVVATVTRFRIPLRAIFLFSVAVFESI